MKKGSDYSVSSGNVFADLGVSAPEEALAKAKLTAQISEIIAAKGLTQAAAARVLGIDQPKVSVLLRGKLMGFSTERLIRFLNALGRDVEIVVSARSRTRGPGHLQVVAGQGGAAHSAGGRGSRAGRATQVSETPRRDLRPR